MRYRVEWTEMREYVVSADIEVPDNATETQIMEQAERECLAGNVKETCMYIYDHLKDATILTVDESTPRLYFT